MSFFKRKKDEPKIPPPATGAYGSSSSYADDYGPDEYAGSAYSRSGGLQPGQPTGRGRSVSPSGYGSQPYSSRSRYDTPDDPSEYGYSSTAVSSRSNVLQKANPVARTAPAREDPEEDDRDLNRRFANMKRPSDPAADAGKRAQLFAGATVKPSATSANSGYSGAADEGSDDEETLVRKTKETRAESRRVLDQTLANGRQMMDTAARIDQRLAQQGEQIGATERHLIAAEGHVNRAGDNVTKINALNRSIFIPSYTLDKSGKRQAEEARLMERYEKEQAARDANQAFTRGQRSYNPGARDGPPDTGLNSRSRTQSSRQLDPDEDEDEDENAIGDGLNELEAILKNIRGTADSIGNRLDTQNQHLRKTEKRVQDLDQNVISQTDRMKRING